MSFTAEPLVDVVIPVHDTSRPLQRAVDSLLLSGFAVPGELRISVVCHNLRITEVAAMLTPETHSKVRFLEWEDREPSPAGPFMHGIRSATAEFVSIMGSDDSLEPGALLAWYNSASRRGLAALIPPERHASGAKIATPPTRPWRRALLHPVRDRLAYRTAPLGLLRRTSVSELDLDMPTRLRSGSDQLFAVKLWFSGLPIAYGRGLPHYVVGADARSRVTFTVRAIEDELRAVRELVTDPWVLALPDRARRSIVTKSYRVHLISSVFVRTSTDRWTSDDARFVQATLRVFSEVAPGFENPLSIADRRLLDTLSHERSGASELNELLAARRRFRSPAAVLTRSPWGLFAIDGPLRYMVASRLL